MRVSISKVWGQLYILPYVKLTYTRTLNGDLELIVGWLKWELVIGI